MHFCRICRTEKNLKYTVKEIRKFSRKRCNDRLLCTTPTIGNICHDCEERLHNFHRLDEHEDNEERVIVDDDELLYNLFFEKVEQQRLMKRLIAVGGGGVGGEWCTTTLRQQTLVASTAVAAVNGLDEVIEVLTSRENTPSPALPVMSSHDTLQPPTVLASRFPKGDTIMNTTTDENKSAPNTTTDITTSITSTGTIEDMVSNVTDKCSPYKVVAVINLDDDEEIPTEAASNILTSQKTPDTDEEEIIFRKVDPEDINVTKNKKRRKRKKGNYHNREINLIASLSLVSSDNDSDVEVAKPECSLEKTNIPPKTVEDKKNERNTPSAPLKVNDGQQSDCQNAGVKCPVCQTEFVASQRLIHHMRRKHRSYDGEHLSERPRCAQDSAMTIRLRYMQRYTYYECQLCGCIDAVFKAHKEHVIQQHAEESKSLKDPMMQTLKCPACKEKCGTQHALLLRHMLDYHKVEECRSHFRQVIHVRNLFSNFSARKEKELQRTARIYQITKRKPYFFECLQCQKVVTGYFNHLKHQKSHGKVVNRKNSATDDAQPDTLPTVESTPESAPRRAKQNSIESKVKCEKSKSVSAAKELIGKKKLLSQKSTVQKNTQSQPRRERKLTKKATQAALLKVKVKPPLKQLPTLRYKCALCAQSFKGFHKLNLHILRLHEARDEHVRCEICLLRFLSSYELKNHERKRHFDKQKRKPQRVSEKNERQMVFKCGDLEKHTCIETNEATADNKRQTKSSISNCIDPGPPDPKLSKYDHLNGTSKATWLQELLVLGAKKQFNITNNVNDKNISECVQNTNCQQKHRFEEQSKQYVPPLFAIQQCGYCAHLFSSVLELRSHEMLHTQRQEDIILKCYRLTNFTDIPASR